MSNVEEIRSHAQNRKFHAAVRDIAQQVKWAGQWMDAEDWKRLLLAAQYEQEVIPSPLGHGFIVRNKRRSSGLTIAEMSDFLGEIIAFGDEHGVKWADEQAAA